jgi:hypothetical protein
LSEEFVGAVREPPKIRKLTRIDWMNRINIKHPSPYPLPQGEEMYSPFLVGT